MSNIIHLLKKEMLLEWRLRYALNGLLLYVVATVFVVYMAFLQVEPTTWITLFWIILLFASINSVTKSFMNERPEQQLYYYTLASPVSIIVAKIIYNFFLLLIIATVGLVAYTILLGSPVYDWSILITAVLLGAFSFATSFTVISAIASRAGNGVALMPILSFPIIIPTSALLIRISKTSLNNLVDPNLNQDILILIAIQLISFSLSFLLFPYIWRE